VLFTLFFALFAGELLFLFLLAAGDGLLVEVVLILVPVVLILVPVVLILVPVVLVLIFLHRVQLVLIVQSERGCFCCHCRRRGGRCSCCVGGKGGDRLVPAAQLFFHRAQAPGSQAGDGADLAALAGEGLQKAVAALAGGPFVLLDGDQPQHRAGGTAAQNGQKAADPAAGGA